MREHTASKLHAEQQNNSMKRHSPLGIHNAERSGGSLVAVATTRMFIEIFAAQTGNLWARRSCLPTFGQKASRKQQRMNRINLLSFVAPLLLDF
jgi:hypothetical protein